MSFGAYIRNLGNAYAPILLAGFLAGTATVVLDDEEKILSKRCLGREPCTEKKSNFLHTACAKTITSLLSPAEQYNSLQVSSGFHSTTNKQRDAGDIGILQSICHARVWEQAREAKMSSPSDPYDEENWALVPYSSELLGRSSRTSLGVDVGLGVKYRFDSAVCHLRPVSLEHEEHVKYAGGGSLVHQGDEREVSQEQCLEVEIPGKDDHVAPGEGNVSDVDPVEEDSDTSLSPDDSNPAISTRIASTSTAATSDHPDEQIEDVDKEDVAKKQQAIINRLQKGLEEEQDLSQSLRFGLNSRERETEVLQKELTQALIRLAQYEEQSDDKDVKIGLLKRQVTARDEELVNVKSKAAITAQQLENPQQSPVVITDQQLLAELERSNQQTQYYYEQACLFEQSAHAAATARSNLESQLKQQQTEFQEFFAQCDEHLDHAGDTIPGLEQQLAHMAQLKDQAEGKTQELQQCVEALGRNLIADYVKDPTPAVANPMTTRPNELRDLQQAFEMSQKNCAEMTKASQDLETEAQWNTREVEYLRESLITEKMSRARLYNSLQKYQSKLEFPGSEGASTSLAQDLEYLSRRNTDLEAHILKMKHQNATELEGMAEKIAVLQEQNIKLDGESFKVHDLEVQVKDTQEQVRMLDDIANSWKNQCIYQAGGNTADVLANTFKEQAERHAHEREALMRRLCQFNAQFAVLEDDLLILREWVSTKLAGIRTLEAERDYNHALVLGLRKHFAEELETKPFDLPWNPNFSTLTSDEERQQLSIEDALIAKVTGFDLRRAEDWAKAEEKEAAEKAGRGKPRGITAKEIWAGIAQAINGTNGPSPRC